MDFMGRRQEKDFHNFEYEKFMPPFAWRDDPICRYLLLDLPGFSKDGLKIELNDDNHVLVSGEKQVSDEKMIHFEQSFKVPEDSDMQKITGKYEGEVLYVVIPKKLEKEVKEVDTEENSGCIEEKHEGMKEEKKESEEENADDNNEKRKNHQEESRGLVSEAARLDPRKQKEKAGIVESVSGMLRRNKGFVVSIILAFSLGVLVSHKFKSDSKKKADLPIVAVCL